MMMLLSGVALPEKTMRQYIAGSINVIIHAARLADGSRKVMRITQISGMEGNTVLTEDLFEFNQTGISDAGKVIGQFRNTGVRSIYSEQLEARVLKKAKAGKAVGSD
jgi:pilus assembly protein CpaF